MRRSSAESACHMFPPDWSDRTSGQTAKRRKLGKKGANAVLLDECSKAAGVYLGKGGQEAERADPTGGGGDGAEGAEWGQAALAAGMNLAAMDFTDKGYLPREYPDNIVDTILREVNNSRFAPAIPEELQLDHVLSSVPYQSMLESLFGGLTEATHDVPLVTKAYEESYMREAAPGEPSCSMGELCECRFVDKNAPFVGVQFELPIGSQPEGGAGEGRKRLQMCVLCCRKTTQKLFYDMCFSGERVQGLIQQFGNLCNQPGEYARCCMLICPSNGQWQCMPRPVMSHQRNRYKVHVVAGLKHLQQLRVAYEDFATPSGTAQG